VVVPRKYLSYKRGVFYLFVPFFKYVWCRMKKILGLNIFYMNIVRIWASVPDPDESARLCLMLSESCIYVRVWVYKPVYIRV